MRKPIIGGNWKMHKTAREAEEFIKNLVAEIGTYEKVETVIFPTFPYLGQISSLAKKTNIAVGAQNMFWEEKGAYTGEVSPSMLVDTGCRYVILGHSERRQYFGETDAGINKKIKAAFKFQLIPLVCVGEKLEERKKGMAEALVKSQLTESLSGISSTHMSQIVIAYEPVWAIGTGETATPEQAQDMHRFIRGIIQGMFDASTANQVRIQYGGSVKPDNAKELMEQADIDGALVGGASLDVGAFIKIVKYGEL